MNLNKLFVTVFYSGLSPKAPGTMGSIVSTIFAILILQYFGVQTLSLLCLLIFVVSFKQIDIYENTTASHDPQEIVVDELIGVWIAIIMAHENIWQILLAFVFFRVFDITKPSIIGKADKMTGAKGVIFDDVIAGFFGGLSSLMTYHLFMKLYL